MGKWLEGARIVRAAMDLAGGQLDDASALEAMALYPRWEAGKSYAADARIRYGDFLYRVVQAHTSQANWTPDQNAGAFCEGEPRGMAGMGAAHGHA